MTSHVPGARVEAMRVYDGDPSRVATLLPGRGYTPGGPLLHYATLLLRHRGWTVRQLWWDPLPTDAVDVQDRLRAALKDVDAAVQLLVGKSLGTFGLPVAGDRAIPGIWLTPVLTDDVLAAAVPVLRTPSLLVGGTADELWDGARARTGDPEVVRVIEVPGADHSMEIPGDELASVDVLRIVVAQMAAFVDEHVDRERR